MYENIRSNAEQFPNVMIGVQKYGIRIISVKVRLTCTILWFRHFNKVDQSIFVVIKFRLRQNLGRIQVLLKEVWNFVFLDFLNQIYKFDSN